MLTIEPVINPDDPDTILCYLVIDEYDIPRGNYDTYDDARDAIKALQGDPATVGRPTHHTAYYPS